ncbi:MAG: EamA/RhaT family transporter, partial [Candidatus Puniceispirillum sp.]
MFLSSAIWGLLWVPMRYLESIGLSGLWAVVLFHLLPVVAMLPFMRSLVAIGRHHWGPVLAAGLLMG